VAGVEDSAMTMHGNAQLDQTSFEGPAPSGQAQTLRPYEVPSVVEVSNDEILAAVGPAQGYGQPAPAGGTTPHSCPMC
jgi:hypothetical protein